MHSELFSIPKASRCCISPSCKARSCWPRPRRAIACWSRTSNYFALTSKLCSADAAVPPENSAPKFPSYRGTDKSVSRIRRQQLHHRNGIVRRWRLRPSVVYRQSNCEGPCIQQGNSDKSEVAATREWNEEIHATSASAQRTIVSG